MEKLAKEELKEQKEKELAKLVKKLNLETEEDKNKIKTHFKVIVKHFEKGVEVEVRTPLIEKPEETSKDDNKETKEHKQRQKELYDVKVKIDKINKQIYTIELKGLNLNLPEPKEKEGN